MSPTKLAIKDWDEKDRPREKLLNFGAGYLSNAELLAIILGSGNKKSSALDLAKEILSDNNNNLDILAKKDVKQLMQYEGVGLAKAISIVAAFELGKRRQYQNKDEKKNFTSSYDVFKFLCPFMCDLTFEEFRLLTLNNKNEVISNIKISQGGIDKTFVDVKVIFKYALLDNATGIIIAHNHTSNIKQPSKEDFEITEKVKIAAEIFDIRFLDHLIIIQNDFFSFADKGLL